MFCLNATNMCKFDEFDRIQTEWATFIQFADSFFTTKKNACFVFIKCCAVIEGSLFAYLYWIGSYKQVY